MTVRLRTTVPKVGGGGGHRGCTSAETLARVAPHMARIGITRVADITGLDRIGIPVCNAIVPRSSDDLSVYNGKGVTLDDATASAVMEAVERWSAWLPRRPDRIASTAELTAAGERFVDPLDHNMAPHPRYRPDRPMSWLRGTDLLNEQSVLVPQFLAGYHTRFHELPCYRITTSNGIASGNSVEEALCHALLEVLERDDWTMADLVSHRLRRTVMTKLGAAAPPGSARWLEDRNPLVDLATLPAVAQDLAGLIAAVGARVVVRDIRQRDGAVPSFAAMIAEDLGPTVSGGHSGYGTHPDATIAVLRAITEAAQSRAVDIQGLREDLTLAGQKVERWNLHTHRGLDLDLDAWPFGSGDELRDFAQIADAPSDDVMSDVATLLDEVRARGLTRAVAVDLSPPEVPAHVVSVVVPGLEQWSVDQGKLGKRATTRWDAALAELIARRDRVEATV